MAHPHFDLARAAHQVALENGFTPDFPNEVRAELAAAPRADSGEGVRDMRDALWSSIDNAESMDLDQIEIAERLPGGRIRLLVGVADVDALVPRGSAIDQHAGVNTCSVYTAGGVFPMLPSVLSEGRTSLAPGEERLAVVLEVDLEADGTIGACDAFRARVRNHAKLAYDDVAAWLETGRGLAALAKNAPGVAGLDAQLRLQDEAAQALRRRRYEHGALDLETLEARAVSEGGRVVDIELQKDSRSRQLIEDLMIAANGAMARFMDARKRSSIRRVVRTPERWQRIVELAATYGATLPEQPTASALSHFLTDRKAKDPERFADLSLSVVKLMGPGEYALDRAGADREGHFGLAVQDYTHATAPNRRYADLVTQRILKAALAKAEAPYADEELATIAARCTARDAAARKVERTLRKMAAALFLQDRVGQSFDAIVTGVTPHGTFVRIVSPPAEGRIVKGEAGLDVGDATRVKLVATEPSKGFIDFVTESSSTKPWA